MARKVGGTFSHSGGSVQLECRKRATVVLGFSESTHVYIALAAAPHMAVTKLLIPVRAPVPDE